MNERSDAQAPLSVLVPVKNEAANLPDCLASVSFAREIVVVDSASTDNTTAIAEEAGARVVQFVWNGKFPRKKNWALENVPWQHEWVLIVDADERIRTNPCLGTDDDRRAQQRKIGLGIIVCSRAKVRAMRDRDAWPQRDSTEIVNKRLLADRAFVSGLEIPREINCRRWIHMYASTNFSSETTKQKSPPAKARPRTETKKRLRKRP